jgi:8-oxo-dGTP pyrophosphatase MutT (NUDIX family)
MPSRDLSLKNLFEMMLSSFLRERERKVIREHGLRPSAVIIPVFEKEGKLHLLFTKRTSMVRHHKGQISFPGGQFDPQDGDLSSTAIRECFEEIGLKEEDINIIGVIDDEVTLSDFRITPYVATFPYPYPFVVNGYEIEELIEIPIEALTDDAIIREEIRFKRGRPYHIYFYRFKNHIIWGATARIVKMFLKILDEAGILIYIQARQ